MAAQPMRPDGSTRGPNDSTRDSDVPTLKGAPPVEVAYRFFASVPVRFADIDVGGHAHHAKVLSYLEEARWAYWTQVGGRPASAEGVDYILADASVRYRARILYPDTLNVGVRAQAIGRKHVTLGYEVRGGDGTLRAEATTVLVLYDYKAGQSVSVPEALRARLEAHEGAPLPRRTP
jgi:acyl-CoA thioester hydrolase